MILLLLEPKRITIKLYMDIGENILENKTHIVVTGHCIYIVLDC